MAILGTIFAAVGGLISLVCYIMVLVKMFQHGKTGLAILCIVLLCVCGIGGLIAFIYGWMKAGEWNLRNVMMAWTLGIVLQLAGTVMNPGQIQQLQEIQQKQNP
jgi:hypothetical protein